MRQKNKLNFTSDEKKNNQRLKYFLIAFAVFIVVLGTVSLLMFMKSLDFDLNNLIKSEESTTQEVTETTTQEVKMIGRSNVLFVCGGADNSIDFAFVVKTDMPQKQMSVCYIDPSVVSIANNTTAPFSEHYMKFGTTGFVRAVEDYSGITIDRYIKVNETQFKSFVTKCGDVVVDVAAPISSKQSGGLSLDAGTQSLSGDMFIKYIPCADNQHRSEACAAFLKSVFSSSNVSSQDSLFTYLANNSETTISIIDYTNRKAEITGFIQGGGTILPLTDLGNLSEAANEEKN